MQFFENLTDFCKLIDKASPTRVDGWLDDCLRVIEIGVWRILGRPYVTLSAGVDGASMRTNEQALCHGVQHMFERAR